MIATIEAAAEGFPAVVSAWNLYGLPALLAGCAVAWVARSRGPGPHAWWERRRSVSRIGLIHFGLAAWAVIAICEEVRAARVMGIFPANPVTGLPGSVLLGTFDLLIGWGLFRGRPRARRGAIALAAIRALAAAWATSWVWQYGAVLDLDEWPGLAVGRAWPPIELAILLLPGTARAFRPGPDAHGRWDGLVALATRLAMVVVASVVAVDAADSALRLAVELTLTAP